MENLYFSLKQIASWTSGISEVTIPAIQRGLVWKPNQVELLWDSILRGFPIGSFLLSDVVERNNHGKYYLMDGQQRYNAISIGFNTVPDARAVLWIDIDPPIIKNSTRIFWIKATTIPHPWGYKNDDESSRLNTSEKRAALQTFNLDGNIYNNTFSLKSTWPVESNCPIPLWCFIQATYETENAESFFQKACQLFQTSDFAFREKVNITDTAKAYVINTLFPAFKALKDYRINCNHLPQSVMETETNNDTSEQTTLEVLFTRLNTGGTQISRDDLNYSAIKAYWPSIRDVNDKLAEKYMNPSQLVMLAFRLALTSDSDKGLRNDLSIKQIRSYANKKEERKKIEALYKQEGKESKLERILSQIDNWLKVTDTDNLRTPSILRTLIAKNSPDIYLLLMYLACKNQQKSIDLTASEIRSLAFSLHWFSADIKGCVQEIFSRCKNGINKTNIQKGIAQLIHDCKLLPIYSPEEVQNFTRIKESAKWYIGESIPAAANIFFDRIFWYGNTVANEILLYAEREYINNHFANYDPARQDLWAEYNRPWDFDHIVARNRIAGKQGDYREYDKVWLNSIGNMAAISFESNRSKNAGEDYSEYTKNQTSLFYDNAIENLKYDITYDAESSVQFAKITFKRFCRIYAETYKLFKDLYETTILSETLLNRKNMMSAIADYYKIRGEQTVVHFAASDNNDYLIEREQDWCREWIGVGVIKNDYMICFEWHALTENNIPLNAEIGIRKALGSQVTTERTELLLGQQKENDNLNPWWYIVENCSSLEIDYITDKMDYYLSKVSEKMCNTQAKE